MLCAAKFSVKHTAELLQVQNAPTEVPEYAKLETALEETSTTATDLTHDISTASFQMLPLDAQIQVMQEKAAHRLLAQALHHQMLEELHNNPALAADPDQQLHFKRLAQQQLLYQMALAAQAATPRDELQATAGARVASDVQPNGTNRDGMDQDTMESAWGEMHYIGSRWASERQRFSNTAMNEEALYGQPERVSLPLNDIFGAIGTAEVVSVTHSDRHEIRACQIRVESSGIGENSSTSVPPKSHGHGKTAKRSPHPKAEEAPLKRVKLQLAGNLPETALAMPFISEDATEFELKHWHDGVGELSAKAPPKRRAWLNAEEQAAMKFPQSAASARLLKQLADFNPSGKDDSAPNVLLPNEHEAKERGTSWRLQTDGDGSVMLGVNTFGVRETREGANHTIAGDQKQRPEIHERCVLTEMTCDEELSASLHSPSKRWMTVAAANSGDTRTIEVSAQSSHASHGE